MVDGWPHNGNQEVQKMEAPSMMRMTMINDTYGYDNDDNDVGDYNDDIDDDTNQERENIAPDINNRLMSIDLFRSMII